MGEERSQPLVRGGLSGSSFVSLKGGSCCSDRDTLTKAQGLRICWESFPHK